MCHRSRFTLLVPQAVIRLSKQYLPGVAEGLTHPKSTVHVGDGFKFLDEYKNAFDVIITDSSDPDGPAESLFQKSYFQLLHDALREGGVITTQGCMSRFFHMESRGVPRHKAVCEKRSMCQSNPSLAAAPSLLVSID